MVARAERTQTDQLVLAIPPDPSAIAVSRLFAAAACRHLGMGEDSVDDVKIAISEAVTNAVKAHLESGSAHPIRILVETESDEVIFRVIDAGPGFDLSAMSEAPDAVTPPAGLYEGSLGLTVIRSLFPNLAIQRNEGQGMTVSFRVVREAATD